MVKVLEKLMEFCSSLKLAICLILSLATYLAAATFYEARYGTRAVQEVIYSSKPFILLMAMLSINVMAAVIVRYPWKRKQTGFIITHAGIETLLLGCLISFRFSVDGKVSMEPGQKSEVINLNDEEVGVTMADAGGRERRWVYPVHLWRDAGYPGMARYAASKLGLIDLPQEPRWPQGHTVTWNIDGGARLKVLDWLPAAVAETNLQPSPDGFPAAIVHLGGSLPNGMPMDQTIPLIADGQGGGMVRPFGGTLEMDLWKARSEDEVQEFLNPPPPSELTEMGRVDLFIDGTRYPVGITQDNLNKPVSLGKSGYTATIEDYILHVPPPQLPENHGAAAMASESIDPQIRLQLAGPNGTHRYLLAAWHPQFVAHLDDADPTQHGVAAPDDPMMWYWHPQTYVTTPQGTRGRLWLLQAPDGKLYARMFQLPNADQTIKPPFEVQTGVEMKNFWLNISFAVTQHLTSGIQVNEFRPAHVTAQQMDDHTRAIKVAVDVDGSHQEVWVEREGVPVELNTPRGPLQLDYNFREYELGFTVGLDHAEQTNDPGSDQAAAYSSTLTLIGSDDKDGQHTISMNEPLTSQGLTFYQAGFANVEGTAISTLSVRRDPGWIIKYLGCAGIIGGIFTMFYMKAYFQKQPAAAPATAKKKTPLAGAVTAK